MIKTNKTRFGGALAVVMLLAVACTPAAPGTPAPATPAAPGTPAAPATPAAPGTPSGEGGFHLGVSNTIAGNGWREEMVCSIRAQALVSGDVDQLTVAHRNTDAQGQLEDIRNLIAAGVDAIIVNPASPEAVNAALQEAIDQGIIVVSVDQAVTLDEAYLLANNQEEYGYLGASWLFEQLGGEGDVVYMRGAAGAPADDDRHAGWERALAENPGINVVFEQHTGWDQTVGVQQINDFLATGQNYDGIWTSGIDNVIVEALQAGGHELVPIVGADNAGFVEQLQTVEGLEGAAVTNPASVGGAGVTLAVQILNGQEPADPHVLVDPEVWDNTTDEGRAAIDEAFDPEIDPTWPLGIHIPDWTTYTKEQILACQGPGE
jgi:ribose transport system substrate-binding protein